MAKLKVHLSTPTAIGYLDALVNIEMFHDDNIKKCDMILFTGGSDVHPRIYKETKHPFTQCDVHRDVEEVALYNDAMEYGIPILGICRGAQLITVMNGGKLIQHVTNHRGRKHQMYTPNATYQVNSTHHQMMYPFNLPLDHYDILGYSRDQSDEYWKDDKTQYDMREMVEPELVFYKHTQSLAVQFHPELLFNHNRAKRLLTEIVSNVLL